ncbi:S41 family peptidase [Sphingobacterium bambusae]|uniref:S41 family peptidase n=1 Tax=Sphingobacterium bambusae TaxID=662858 RepID=A0ABW6BP44_9SPHI|nr:S41 family peptidase [Sphingobacterium bambusae]WPL48144.1 S41 family peptidase [Sphingobacterium bambusae]
MIKGRHAVLYSILMGSVGFFQACQKDDPVYPAGTNEAINQWIDTEMDQYYYWRDKRPAQHDQSANPISYFHMLLAQEDRFSTILQSQNQDSFGKTLANTFGLDIISVEQGNQSLHLISQVVPFSAAATAGLARGDSIEQINGVILSQINIEETVIQALALNRLQLRLKKDKLIDLPSSYIAQPVVYTYRLLNDQPNTGYLYLSHFDFSGAYDVLEAVKKLKEAEVSNLILDLRYNPGGQVSFAAFCALLFAPVQANEIFVRYRGNKRMAAIDDTFADALARQPDGYSFSVAELIAARLPLRHITVLTTGHTASAAELLINNLRPYIAVIHIGENTLGKDMASVTRSSPQDINGDQATWHILPLVYKMYNRENVGDYAAGIVPQQLVQEYRTLPLYPFGDSRDPLLVEALQTANKNVTSRDNRQVPISSKPTSIRFESRPYEHHPILLD